MTVASVQSNSLEHLLGELRRITSLVSRRVQELRATEPETSDEFLGLYISPEEINELLSDPDLFRAGSPEVSLQATTPDPALPSEARLGRLQQAFGLSPFEMDVILIALAPELDLRYEKIYAFLQDDVNRRRPGVDLALRLLCPGLAGQVAARRCFDADAPLIKFRLIELGEESQNRQQPMLSRTIKLDEGIVAFLLNEEKLDMRLRTIASFGKDIFLELDGATEWLAETRRHVTRMVELAEQEPICVLTGPDELSKRSLALEICRRLMRPLIVVDTALLITLPKVEGLLRLLERETRLHRAAIYWASYEALFGEEQPGQPQTQTQEARRLITRLLSEQNRLGFIASTEALTPLQAGPERSEFQLELGRMSYSERQRFWESQLGTEALGLDLESLSSRFRLSRGQIVLATATARHAASWRGESAPTLADLETACRSHSNQKLGSLARKITPRYRWEDLVLPTDQHNMLREITEQVQHRALVYEKWGFDKKLSLGKGLNVIFAGPSGTGKTMSAEIMAGELRMDLYRIDLSNVVSKYIGETEKNLERIFTEAGESNAILFFDEADSLFGKRSEVKDAHDRYANIETGYLLQRMEEYDGIVILATNLRRNLDDAFIRRMHFIIEYPFPEEDDRLQIWQRVFANSIPISENVDLRFMARQFKIAGGNIKNIGLATAFLAASEPAAHHTPVIEMSHLIRATRREFQKTGKLCTEADFGPYFSWLKDAK